MAAYDRSMLRLPDGEELCPEEARALARYGMPGLQVRKRRLRHPDKEPNITRKQSPMSPVERALFHQYRDPVMRRRRCSSGSLA